MNREQLDAVSGFFVVKSLWGVIRPLGWFVDR